ncbi:MAG TPA: hypothetical protein VHS56_14425 [Candidatus Cybelea sp.]|nr:hypothetical protein [Candidatus Cybelea sp.]
MGTSTYSRALTVSFGAVLLASCGGSQPPMAGGTVARAGRSSAHHQDYRYTGKAQSFVVPKGVAQITVVASCASGPIIRGSSCQRSGGKGGLVHATIPVRAGEKLGLFVGGRGALGWGCDNSQYGNADGGFNGGGDGGPGIFFYNGYYANWAGDGGGGASDVRQGGDSLAGRIVVAAGGGGGAEGPGVGGAGGGQSGDPGGGKGGRGSCQGWGGEGATDNNGGKGGRGASRSGTHRGGPGSAGTLGVGGAGGAAPGVASGGGGAGGGYYGGGGGGSGDDYHGRCLHSANGGGGGGGSSYVEPTATNVKDEPGAASRGDGKIVIFW